MSVCDKCTNEIGDDWDFWITLSDYSDKELGRKQYDMSVCEKCFNEVLKELS